MSNIDIQNEESNDNSSSGCFEEYDSILQNAVFQTPSEDEAKHLDSDVISLGRIGKYRLKSILGSGGMGIVWDTFNDDESPDACVKMMSIRLAASRNSRLRFEREAAMMGLVKHHNTVRLLKQGSSRLDNGTELLWLVMSKAPGKSLSSILKRDLRFSEERILWVAKELVRGLEAIHYSGLVHRDLKPSNIIIDEQLKRLTIIDFGLARPMRNMSMITMSHQMLGTPAFMSPEQFKGAPLDQRTDLYSVGAILYTMATGFPPFQSDDLATQRKRVMSEQFDPIGNIRPDLTPELQQLITNLLEKNPTRRLDTAFKVLKALEAVPRGQSIGNPMDTSAWCRVILADDDQQFGKAAIHRMKLRGVSMTQSLTPYELYDQLDGEPAPDAILVDMCYGEHDGLDVIRHLREEKPLIPILVLTSARSIDRAVTSIKMGCKEFICKPFDDEKLAELLKSTLSNKATLSNPGSD